MIPRLFVEAPLAPGTLALSAEHRHYLTRVLRRRPGDLVMLLDNSGYAHQAEILEDGACQVGQRVWVEAEPACRVVLIAGLLKGERMDWLVEKATELGVAEIRPVLTARTVAKGGRVARWHKIAVEAAEQCERGRVPTILDPVALPQALSDLPEVRLALLERQGSFPLSPAGQDMVVAVGPEGGWAPQEVDWLLEAGFHPATLGRRILRAETASLAALARLLQT